MEYDPNKKQENENKEQEDSSILPGVSGDKDEEETLTTESTAASAEEESEAVDESETETEDEDTLKIKSAPQAATPEGMQPEAESKVSVEEISRDVPGSAGEEAAKDSGKPMPNWLRNTLIGLAVAIVIFAAGYILAVATQATPARASLQAAQNELSTVQQDLSDTQEELQQAEQEMNDLQGEIDDLRTELANTESELIESQQTVSEREEDLAFVMDLEAMKYNVALSRIALLNNDRLSARQTLNLAEDSFEAISDRLDPETEELIGERLDNLQELITGNIPDAREELRLLTESLERIELPTP